MLEDEYQSLFGEIADFVSQDWFKEILIVLNQTPNRERPRFVEENILSLTRGVPSGITISKTRFSDLSPLFCISTVSGGKIATLWFDVGLGTGLDRLNKVNRGGRRQNFAIPGRRNWRV
jgi:hypothetical protein